MIGGDSQRSGLSQSLKQYPQSPLQPPQTTQQPPPSQQIPMGIDPSAQSTGVPGNEPHSPLAAESPLASPRTVIESIFSTTTCYDLMQVSSKGTVFETTIPFQLAFFALIEHETDVAPLWDPELRSFVGLMTVQDYIRSLRLCLFHSINAMELTTKSIQDMLIATPYIFHNQGFQGLDAEDPVLQLVSMMYKNRLDYMPILDPDNGNLISILGPLDVLHLFDQIARTNEMIFNISLSSLKIGCFLDSSTSPSSTTTVSSSSSASSGVLRYVTKQTLIRECLEMCDQYEISALPVVDSVETKRVVAIYYRSDVSFIMKASDPEAVLHNLRTFRVEDSLAIKDQMLSTGELALSSLTQNLVTVKIHDPVSQVFKALVTGRSHRAVIVDEQGSLRGVVSYRDFIKYFLETFLTR